MNCDKNLKKLGQEAENVELSEEQLAGAAGGQKWYHHPPIRTPIPKEIHKE
jgi:hypothetical protein